MHLVLFFQHKIGSSVVLCHWYLYTHSYHIVDSTFTHGLSPHFRLQKKKNNTVHILISCVVTFNKTWIAVENAIFKFCIWFYLCAHQKRDTSQIVITLRTYLCSISLRFLVRILKTIWIRKKNKINPPIAKRATNSCTWGLNLWWTPGSKFTAWNQILKIQCDPLTHKWWNS